MKYLVASVSLFIANPTNAASFSQSHTVNAGIVIVLYFIFCAWFVWQYKKRTAKDLRENNLANVSESLRDEHSILVAYASQTGNAEQLAKKTAESLKTSALTVEIHKLAAVDAMMLETFGRVLFVVSTTGEGDAPDNARDFLAKVMHDDANFSQLQYAILALGDASYTHFCGFGHTLEAWLQHAHAVPLFDMVEVDRHDDGALRHWQYQLGVLANNTELADWKTPDYQMWQLSSRMLLNEGSAGAPVFRLKLTSQQNGIHWQAGDIAEIGPQNTQKSVDTFLNQLGLDGNVKLKYTGLTLYEALQDKLLPHDDIGFQALFGLGAEAVVLKLTTLPHREYSIASILQEGALELLVRQAHYPDGRLGIGSGWLTEYAAIDSNINLRIRENTGFHPPTNDMPLILIGNGTGIAGLIAHLKTRIYQELGRNWLIFGERNAACDFYYENELIAWRKQGYLTRLDTAFSRDQAKVVYVQDVVRSMQTDIVRWVHDGASIYICGSANGMAPAVHHELLEVLGETTLSAMTATGRYRRDVY